MFDPNLGVLPTSSPKVTEKSYLFHRRLPHMALKISPFSSNLLPKPIKFQTHSFTSATRLPRTHKLRFSCINSNNLSGADLASDFAREVEAMNINMVQREEAMKKSRELLFGELCQHVGLKSQEVEKKWKKLNEDDKLVLVKEFVSVWGDNFHPLSARSVKEMVDEYLVEDSNKSSNSGSFLLPDLWKIMGFSSNKG